MMEKRKPVMKTMVLLLFAVLVSACASTTELTSEGASIKETDKSARALCRMQGMVKGEKYETNAESPEAALQEARWQALNQAAELGATHIMWRGQGKRGSVWVARGRAYKCPD